MWRSALAGGGIFLSIAIVWAGWDPALARVDVRMLGSDSPDWRPARERLLQRGRGSVLALRARLGAPQAPCRLRCAQALGLLGEDEADEVLLEALRGESDDEARMAMALLRELWDLRNGPPAEKVKALLAGTPGGGESLDLALTQYYAWTGGYVARARLYLAQEEPRLAVRDALSALLLEHAEFDALAILGRAYGKLGFSELGVDCLRQAIAVNPRMKAVLHEESVRLQDAAREERERRLKRRYMDLPLL